MNQTATATATATAAADNPPITSRDVSPHEMLQAALDYASRGHYVFPCHGIIPVRNQCTCGDHPNCGKNAGKHPWTRHGLRDATIEHKKIKGWNKKWKAGANIAIRGGGSERLLVIDVDSYKSDADNELAKLELECGVLPRDWLVSTGACGLHIYLTLPEGIEVKSINNWRPGIDLKSSGGYVIAPPSLHLSGGRYTWIAHRGDSPPLLPAAWLKVLPVIQVVQAVPLDEWHSPQQSTDSTETTEGYRGTEYYRDNG